MLVLFQNGAHDGVDADLFVVAEILIRERWHESLESTNRDRQEAFEDSDGPILRAVDKKAFAVVNILKPPLCEYFSN